MRRPSLALAPPLLVLLLSFLPLQAADTTRPNDNVSVAERTARIIADSLLSPFKAGDTVCVHVTAAPGAWVVEVALLRCAAGRNLTIAECEASGGEHSALDLQFVNASLTYWPLDAIDSLERRVAIEAFGRYAIRTGLAESTARDISGGATMVYSGVTFEASALDTIALSDSSFVAGPPPFSPAIPVLRTSGFWTRVVEPAIVLGAAVVMTILLFTVRSQ